MSNIVELASRQYLERDPQRNPTLSPLLEKSVIRRIALEQENKTDELDEQSREDARVLEYVIEQLGGEWPSMDKVGFAASFGAFVIAHNANHDALFQVRCLELMRIAATPIPSEGQVYPPALALMEEKVASRVGVKGPYQIMKAGQEVDLELLNKRLGMGMGREVQVMYPPEFGVGRIYFSNLDNLIPKDNSLQQTA